MGNSPSCNDGAAALVVMAEEEAVHGGLHADGAHRRLCRGGACTRVVYACADRRDQTGAEEDGLSISDIDLFEINEAFSAVSSPSTGN